MFLFPFISPKKRLTHTNAQAAPRLKSDLGSAEARSVVPLLGCEDSSERGVLSLEGSTCKGNKNIWAAIQPAGRSVHQPILQ